jgi:hypothetical protein
MGPVQQVLHRLSWSGAMEWIRCICCKKFWRNLIYWTSALMATGRPVLHRLSCSNEMVRKGPKICFGSNGVDWVRSLWKLRTCCRSKPAGEQWQATRGAGRLPGWLVGLGPSVNGPVIWRTPWLEVARRATWSGRCDVSNSCTHRHVVSI